MRTLRYRYTAIHQILTPLTLEPEAIQLPRDLHQSLALLFPQNVPLFHQQRSSAPAISFVPQAPFGPDLDMAAEVLFADFSSAVSEVKAYFDLPDIAILRPDKAVGPAEPFWSRALPHRRRAALTLGVFEFYRLHAAAIQGKQTRSILMSLFLDPDHKICARVPLNTPLREVFAAIPDAQTHQRQHADSVPFQPMLRRKLDPDADVAGPATTLIMFSQAGYTVAPEASVVRQFPYFDRAIGIHEGRCVTPEPLPCVNCLACAAYCPVGLQPSFLYHHLTHGNTDDAAALHLDQCIRCGACQFVCPSALPLCDAFVRAQQDAEEGEA